MLFRQLFDAETSTYTYLLADEGSREAVLIDPVLEQLARDTELLGELELKLVWAVDTHVHADHVTALGSLREKLGCKTAVSVRAGNACADSLLSTGDTVRFGKHFLKVRETPGHTNGCLTYVSDDETKVFTGDALLIRGCGRTDFQEGDAATLWKSIHTQIFTLPETTSVYPGHDYKGRTVSTVGEEKRHNPRLGGATTEAAFIEKMNALKLAPPKKIDIAVAANRECGMIAAPQDARVDHD